MVRVRVVAGVMLLSNATMLLIQILYLGTYYNMVGGGGSGISCDV